MIKLMEYIVGAGLGFLGLVFGSFAGAQVWRLRARQLVADKRGGEEYSKAEYQTLKPLMGKKQKEDRSLCLHCGHVLGWQDLMPLVSWLSLGGKCRYCNKPIGRLEPLAELATAALFVLSLALWLHPLNAPVDILLFILWLIAIVLMVILTIYDIKWQLLPDSINFSFMGVAAVFVAVRYFAYGYGPQEIISTLAGVGILAGIYAVLYLVSKGAWIGFGDVKLGVGLGLLLGDWKLAFLALFLANLIGCLLVLPAMLTKKLNGKSRIAFGPLLMAGTLIAFWWGRPFIQWLFVDAKFLP